MSEQALQTKIMDWLKAHGFYAVKIIACSKAGTADILACSPKGRFVAIEVKYGRNTPSELQKDFINEVERRDGLAFVTWDLQTVIFHLQGEIVPLKAEVRPTDFLL
ncbi:hypothetical protein ETP1_029 [Edwardsiella phage ETP-1]|uniref:Endonuclease n=3 Tax=Kafunavirus KF1 TaxID=1982588 RepID=A0A6G5P4X0_9CAUD|nr:endonuclease [Edwardsiella phage KF-1]QBP07030.1 hypothetical protein ETP1_029 [Edwardsiella phage ETP-1]BAM63080.1 hypothetical protein [Edwardsiella phage KF-1]BAM63129.1 hypothetical protein [Edwardsiella phage IW-1]